MRKPDVRNSLRRVSAIVPVLLFLAFSQSAGQTLYRSSVGIFGAYIRNFHDADFRALPGVPNCCPKFESGVGDGGALGLLYETPISDRIVFSMRAAYMTQGARLTADEVLPVAVGGVSSPAVIAHSIDVTLPSLGIEPGVYYPLGDRLAVHGGIRLALQIAPEYRQQETLIRPESGTFENGRRIRNEYAGALPEYAPLSLALVAGVSYRVPLDDRGRLSAAPEFTYIYGLTPIISSYIWTAQSFRAGIVLRYHLGADGEELPAQPPVPMPPSKPPSTIAARIAVTGVVDGIEVPVHEIVVEEYRSTNMYPLLPYVFFPEHAAEIPTRYTRVGSQGGFRVESLRPTSTLDVYHHLLNIIGERLQQYPEATITLTGCNANIGVEKGDLALSGARANAVARYLTGQWGIDSTRIDIRARNLPGIPSNVGDPDGVVENRRVEIVASDPRILQPVILHSTETQYIPAELHLRPRITAGDGIRNWAVNAGLRAHVPARYSGADAPPAVLTWDAAAALRGASDSVSRIEIGCAAEDLLGRKVEADEQSLPVRYRLLSDQQRDRTVSGREIQRYSLILFDFDRADLGTMNNTLIPLIRSEIQHASTIRITGYTDRIGESEYNTGISLARARNTATALGTQTAMLKGLGESEPLFDNDLPEGRFYCRTVIIEAETQEIK
ncbi:MAG: OmpA family protein [Bacteroidetes bacterium]|nr:OmpA family protein [Bacteroidota bacterium]